MGDMGLPGCEWAGFPLKVSLPVYVRRSEEPAQNLASTSLYSCGFRQVVSPCASVPSSAKWRLYLTGLLLMMRGVSMLEQYLAHRKLLSVS